MKKFFQFFFSFFFTTTCLDCDTTSIHEPFCPSCSKDHPASLTPLYPSIYFLFSYREPSIRRALWQLKYQNNKKVASYFAKRLALAISKLSIHTKHIYITPIPLHSKRIRERGYNQSIYIAKELALLLPNTTFKKLLKKDKCTKNQTQLHRNERLRNIKDTFSLNNTKLPQMDHTTIIVIDDITTTGATLSEAIKNLHQLKSKKVIGIAVAH